MRKQSGNKPGTPEHSLDFHQENSGKGKAEEQLKNAIALLNAVIDAVSRAESYTEGLQNTLEHVCNITGWNIGEAWEPNAARDILIYSNARYTSDKNLQGFQKISQEYSFSYGSGLPGRAWKQKTPVWIPDVKHYPDFHRAKGAITFGLSAGVAIPVIVDDQVVNVMVFFLKEKKDEDKDFINLISGIAKQLGELFLRKKTEEQVTRLSYEYEVVFNGTQSAMFLVEVCGDGQYRYVRTNAAYERMSGYSQKDTAGKTPYDLFGKKGGDDIIKHYEECIKTGQPHQYELSIRHRDKLHIIDAELNPIFEDGSVKYIAGSSTNITEKKKILDELLVAKEKAEASDHLKTAFLNNISHEVRTPLNGLLGFGQLLSQEGLTSHQKRSYMKSMNKSSRRLIDTIEKIIDISMILSNNLEINIQKVEPVQVVNEVRNLANPASTEKGLTLETSIPENIPVPSIQNDAALIRKVLSHLADNAIKFTNKGTVVIGLMVRDDAMVFYIKDTGSGMSEEYQEKLYQPFSQEDVAMTRGFEGSGLGLSIAAGIVEKLGGKIWAESEKDAGSKFYVSFPLPKSEKSGNESTAALDHTGSSLAQSSTTKDTAAAFAETDEPDTPPKQSILLADDDDMALFLLETLIEDIGVPLISATNGKEAVEAFRSNPGICLVITDVKMPVMDGIEATRQIKAIRKDVPVIAVTAHAMSGDEQRILAAGCDDYIAKPLSGKELLEKINKLVPGLV